jgi:hypothetical protein
VAAVVTDAAASFAFHRAAMRRGEGWVLGTARVVLLMLVLILVLAWVALALWGAAAFMSGRRVPGPG